MYWPFSGEEEEDDVVVSCDGCDDCKVVIKSRLNCCLGREVLLLRRCGYNRVIASTVEKERGGGEVRTNAELEGVWYFMSVVLETKLSELTEDLFAKNGDCEGFFLWAG